MIASQRHRSILILLVFGVMGSWALIAEASAGLAIEARPMLDFTHFLYGTSGAFPQGAAFSRDWLRWKKVLDTSVEKDLETIAGYFRRARSGFPDEHLFECRLYQSAALEGDLNGLLKTWAGSIASFTDAERVALARSNELFDRVAAADPRLVATELRRLGDHPAMRLFRRNLGEIGRFFGNPRLSEPWRIVAIPLRLTPQEMAEARKRGANSIFGRSFGALQVVELVIIPEQPELADRMLTHILGVALHEIIHQFYAMTGVGKAARTAMDAEQDLIGFLASSYLNEGLATALGNGVFQSRLGSGDPQWYSRSTVNAFGHALFPLVERYLAGKKRLDRPFFAKAKELFGEAFPRAERWTEFSLIRFRLFGRQELQDAFGECLKRFLPCYYTADETDRPRAEILLVTPDDLPLENLLSGNERSELSLLARHGRAVFLSRVDRGSGVTRCLVLVQTPGQTMELLGKVFSNRTLPRRLLCGPRSEGAGGAGQPPMKRGT